MIATTRTARGRPSFIPLNGVPSLATPVENGATMSVNFYRYNRPADQEHPVTSAWSVVGPGSFHNPPRFGVATFVGAPERVAESSGEGSGAAAAETGRWKGAAAPTLLDRRVRLPPARRVMPNAPRLPEVQAYPTNGWSTFGGHATIAPVKQWRAP